MLASPCWAISFLLKKISVTTFSLDDNRVESPGDLCNDPNKYCTCGNCKRMETPDENTCCSMKKYKKKVAQGLALILFQPLL